MDRLTTNNPETNVAALLNIAFAGDDRKVKLRIRDGKAPHIDLCEYVSRMAAGEDTMCDISPQGIMEGGCMVCDLTKCSCGTLYFVATQAAELRARLMMIEDILGDSYDLDHLRDLIEAERENQKPLTIEELRQVNGEPLWLTGFEWRVCYGTSTFRGSEYIEVGSGISIPLDGYGESWFAYRHKPKEA